MKQIFPIIAGVAVAVVAGYGGYRYASQAPSRSVTASVPANAAQCSLRDTQLRDASDQPPAVSAWQGRVVLLNFWASWCGPCRHEMPALRAIASRFAAQRLSVVGVAVDDPASAQRLAREVGVGYPLLYGRNAADELLQACSAGTQGLPMSVVLDRRGRVCARHAGALDEAGFARLLQPCLAR